jgi:REP element-mobilizing transposase RayT
MARKSGYGIKINRVQPDHVHVLFHLGPGQTVDQMVGGFQRNSRTYLSDNGLCDDTFQWAQGYHAFSVSRSTLDETIQYISDQRIHHRRMSMAEELALFRRLYEYPG